jgi:hypothetical protein
MQEVWKDVVGYEDYFMVSNLGNIFSKRSKRNLKPGLSKSGYRTFTTRLGGRGSEAILLRVHRLVAEAFLPPPPEDLVKKCESEHYGKVIVRHLDNNKNNNNVENLAWGSCKDNTMDWMCTDSYTSFRESQNGCNNKGAKLSEDDVKYIRENYIPYDKNLGARALAVKFNVHHKRICDVASGKSYR